MNQDRNREPAGSSTGGRFAPGTDGKTAPTTNIVPTSNPTDDHERLAQSSLKTFLEHFQIEQEEKALHKYGKHTKSILEVLTKSEELESTQIGTVIREWGSHGPTQSLMDAVVEIVQELEPMLLCDPLGQGIWSVPAKEGNRQGYKAGYSHLLRIRGNGEIMGDPIRAKVRDIVNSSFSDPSMDNAWRKKALGNAIYYSCLALIAKDRLSVEDYQALTFAWSARNA